MSEGTEFIGLHDESEFHGFMAGALVPDEANEATVSRWTKYNQSDGVFPARLRDGEQLVLVRIQEPAGLVALDINDEDGFKAVSDDQQWYWIDRSKYHKAKRPNGSTGPTTAYGPSGEQVVACASTKGAGLVWRLRLDDAEGEDGKTYTNWLVMGVKPMPSLAEALEAIEDLQVTFDKPVAEALNIERFAVVHRRLESEDEIRPGITRRNYSIQAVVPVADKASGRQMLQAVREAHLLHLSRSQDGSGHQVDPSTRPVPEDAAF